VVTQLATAKIGVILVTVNPAYRVAELEYALNKVGCRALVMADKFKTSNYIEMVQSLAPEIAACDALNLDLAKLPSLDWVAVLSDEVPDGFIRYAKLMEMADAARREEAANIEATLDCDEAINIQFTSGTTGFPKGATLTHRNILNNGYNVVTRQNFTSADRLCIPVPLYHCFGMVMGVLGCITHGAAMVFPDEAFDPESVMKAVQAENCTALYGVPTMFIAELALSGLGRYDLSMTWSSFLIHPS